LSELRDFPDDGWDRAMKADAATGRLDFIDQQVTRTAEGDQLVLLDIVLRDGE
jgi:hypothetical protein